MIIRSIDFLVGALAAIMAASCAGAVWALMRLITGNQAALLAILCAVLLVYLLQKLAFGAGIVRAVAAALLTTIAIVHACYIAAAGMIAAEMSFGLLESMRRIGPEMAFAMARAHTSIFDIAVYAIAVILAFALGYKEWRGAGKKIRRKRANKL
jgi:hypothetical protein